MNKSQKIIRLLKEENNLYDRLFHEIEMEIFNFLEDDENVWLRFRNNLNKIKNEIKKLEKLGINTDKNVNRYGFLSYILDYKEFRKKYGDSLYMLVKDILDY